MRTTQYPRRTYTQTPEQTTRREVNELIQKFQFKPFAFEAAEHVDSGKQDAPKFAQMLRDDIEVYRKALDIGPQAVNAVANHMAGRRQRLTSRSAIENLAMGLAQSLGGEAFMKFLQDLAGHDWHYAMSDDLSSYSAGKRRRDELWGIAQAGGEHWVTAFNLARQRYGSIK